MANAFSIEGIQDCERFFDAQPGNILKLTKKAMQAGGRAGAREIKGRVDKRWRYLIKQKTSKSRDGDLTTLFGLFNGKQIDGTQPKSNNIPTFFKAYWKNYGTLEGRDPSHQFQYPVKPAHYAAAQNRKNRTGEVHTNFFEAASAGVEQTFQETFNDYMADHAEDLYER